ncbi:MAG: alpha/beta hydrolase [Planctomycetota bacterium]|nr:alpha/beta hydrolase [Planctomycetota bacterium]
MRTNTVTPTTHNHQKTRPTPSNPTYVTRVRRATSFTLLLALPLLPACAAHSNSPPNTFSFTLHDRTYNGAIASPPAESQNDFAVLLIGGGLANDLDWTTPSDYAIKGEPHYDAIRLTEALTSRGFTVGRWSTIHRDDPHADHWPERATTNAYPEALELAAAALDAFSETSGIPADRIALLGHSLGATRAVHIVSRGINPPALALLAPARLARTGPVDDDGRAARAEGRARFDALLNQSLDAPLPPDFDGDGHHAPWEFAADFAIRQREHDNAMRVNPRDRFGLEWPEDILLRADIPTLIVCGGLDHSQSMYGPIIQRRAEQENNESIRVEYLPGLGHTLGAERNGKIGPISQIAIDLVADWLTEILTQ